MASIGIGALGEPAIAHALEPLFGNHRHGFAVAVSRGDRLRADHVLPEHRR